MTKYLIDFEQNATLEQIQGYFQRNSCVQLHIYNNFDKVYLVESENTPPIESIITSVINDSESNIAPLNNTAVCIDSLSTSSITIDDDKNWWKVVTYVNVDFTEETLNIKRFGSKVTIYLLDSGVDLTHPEFQGENVSQIYTFNGNPTDVNGHGTALASLITGKDTSMTSCKLVSLKIFEDGVPTPLSKLLEAFDIIYTDSLNQKASIVNMSWSIPNNEYVNNKLRLLHYGANIGLVAAAGNSGQEIKDVTPACLDEVFVVGAYDQNLLPCNFSNYTSDLNNTPQETNHGELDVWAPGESIYVALPENNYGFVSGTSFSAAIHTAALAADIDIQYSLDSNTLISKTVPVNEIIDSGFAVGRPGLLELSGKYLNSVNMVTSMYPTDKFSRIHNLPSHLRVVTGEDADQPLMSQTACKSMTILSELPPGLSITEFGWLVGVHSSLPEGVNYTTWPLSIEYIMNDGSVVVKNYDLYIVSPDLQPTDVPDDLIWITQLARNCSEFIFNCGFDRCPITNNRQLRYCWNLNGFKNPGCEYCCVAANCCFTPETKIIMSDLTSKEIKDLVIGDKVLVYDLEKNLHIHKEVKCVITRTERPMYTYTFDNGVTLNASEDHPLYVKDKGWASVIPPNEYKDLKSVQKIEIGDIVKIHDNSFSKIVKIEELDYPDTVYELDTSGFYANGVLAY